MKDASIKFLSDYVGAYVKEIRVLRGRSRTDVEESAGLPARRPFLC